jgi:hypothetical protein
MSNADQEKAYKSLVDANIIIVSVLDLLSALSFYNNHTE